jgi:hypothetical protein
VRDRRQVNPPEMQVRKTGKCSHDDLWAGTRTRNAR